VTRKPRRSGEKTQVRFDVCGDPQRGPRTTHSAIIQDETRFGRINDPHQCWAPEPLRPVVKSAVIREFTSAFAAVSPMNGHPDSLVLPEASTETMNLHLNEVSSRYLNEFIVMILDGAGWHTAKKLNVHKNIKLNFLPPYSPELNPTENLWDELREKASPIEPSTL
jgi:hypothetical protein